MTPNNEGDLSMPYCEGDNPPSYCREQWCYVDAKQCTDAFFNVKNPIEDTAAVLFEVAVFLFFPVCADVRNSNDVAQRRPHEQLDVLAEWLGFRSVLLLQSVRW